MIDSIIAYFVCFMALVFHFCGWIGTYKVWKAKGLDKYSSRKFLVFSLVTLVVSWAAAYIGSNY